MGSNKNKTRARKRRGGAKRSSINDVLGALELKRSSDSEYCAFQQLHTDLAVKHGRLVGPPLEEVSTSFKFATTTTVQVAAVPDTTANYNVAACAVRASGPAHVYYTTATNHGLSTASTDVPAYGSAEWGSRFEAVRMVASTMTVHQRTMADKENGDVCLTVYNPVNNVLGSVTPSEFRDSPSVVAGCVKTDMYKMPWIPVRQDKDFQWRLPTDNDDPKSTCIIFSYQGEKNIPAAFTITVDTVWEALVTPSEFSFFRTSREDINQDIYDAYISLAFRELPLYSLGRHVGPDGFWGDAWGYAKKLFKKTPVGALIDSGADLISKGRTLVSNPSLESFVDVMEAGTNLAGIAASVATDEERVIMKLVTFNQHQLKMAAAIIAQCQADRELIVYRYKTLKKDKFDRNCVEESKEDW